MCESLADDIKIKENNAWKEQSSEGCEEAPQKKKKNIQPVRIRLKLSIYLNITGKEN
jgi:hypothetical protein